LNRKLLVTSALEDSWGDNEEIVFLGEWCKKYSRKHRWQERNSSTLGYHWRDRTKLEKDHIYLENLYAVTLLSLSTYLNKFHCKDNGVDYWRLIVGPWLITYIAVLWDRWECLEQVVSESSQLKTIIPELSSIRNQPNDFGEASNLFDSDIWNHQVFASIILYRSELNIQIEKISDDFLVQTQRRKKIPRINSRSILRKLGHGFDKILDYFLPKNTNLVLFESYFPRFILLRLSIKLKLVPRAYAKFYKPINYPPPISRENLKKVDLALPNDSTASSFEHFLFKNILFDMPVCHFEGYEQLIKCQSELPTAKTIFTANAHFGNELFKVWAAEQKENGAKLVISSHGGALYPLHSIFDHQEKIANTRVIWGSAWIKGQIRLPPSKLKRKALWYKSKGHISLIDYDHTNYSYRCASIPMGPLSLECYEQNMRLVNLLSPEVKDKLKIRPKLSGKWQKKQRYIDSLGPEIISTEQSLESTILNSRLVICSYPQTTFSEAMFSGVPTMIVYLEEFWEVQPIYRELLVCLKDAGIMHTDENLAASHINNIFDDPMDWWNADTTKDALKLFNDMCLTDAKDPINSWVKFFNEISNVN
jgi:putative transferase (TIGR04331 family)